jgi:hypothetical protein
MRARDYTNHSGGAEGSDKKWDEIGRKYGVTEHVHWKPRDLDLLPLDQIIQMKTDVEAAAKVLMRPWRGFKGAGFIQRNWLQVRYADAIYAIGHIIAPGEVDYQGYTNETGKEIVAGGTGWAVEMAIQKGKPVYVFDMTAKMWYYWDNNWNGFVPLLDAPTLTKSYAGIGSRLLTPEGEKAIEDVYINTFNYAKTSSKEEEADTTP